MMLLRSIVVLSLIQASLAQFSCSLSGASDSNSCTSEMDDSNEHCVWCSVGGSKKDLTEFGFCVNESQAKAMEDNLPIIHCDRYSGDSDDDAAPDDDSTKSDDDQLPDNYWKCLKATDAKECKEENDCTWCNTKGGFGLCLSGPSADAAKDSDWFTCDANLELDVSCATAFLQDPTRDGCANAVDENGNSCEFCTILNGLSAVCLTAEQAGQAPSQLGVSCDALVNDPYDPSCLMAYLQDPSKEGCIGSTDSDGVACEFCSLQGALDLCLTEEQAEMGEQFGISCGEAIRDDLNDPYDPTCMLEYLQDPTKEGCVNTVDADGNPCEYCTLQGAIDVCLTEEQAEMGEQFGISCEDKAVEDPYDPSCVLAYLQDSTPEFCKAAVDADGNACEYCTLQGSLNVCLTEEQAEMAEQFGIDCEEENRKHLALPDDFFECLQEFQEGDCRASSCTWCNTEVGIGFCLSTPAAEATKECTFFDCELGETTDVLATA